MNRILSAIAALGVALSLHAQSTHVLFIGNSYTSVNDLPELTGQLALSMGNTLAVASSSPGGYTFQQHTTYAATQNLIDQGAWDFVVLQEQSQLPSFPPAQVAAQCLPYAAQLVGQVRAASPCAEAVFYMTWGRENGDQQNCAGWPPVCTYEGMQQQLRQSYLQMAQDNSAECAPAGMAWKRMRAEFPAINLYSSDGSHPSVAGSYLVACTLYSTFFRTSSVGASFTSSLDAATALTLQQVASSVVLDSLGTWNIGVHDPVALPQHTDLGGGQVQFSQNSTGTTAHFWNLGDGSTSFEGTFTHTYANSGTYTVVYVATDDCGRTDTSTFTVQVLTAGIAEVGKPAVSVTGDAQGLVVVNAGAEGTLDLFDLQGRRLSMHPIGATGKEYVPLPSGTAVVWRFQTGGGRVGRGLVVIP